VPLYVMRVTYRSTLDPTGQAVVNVMHVNNAQLTSGDQASSVITDIDAWLTTAYKNVLTDSTKLHDLTVSYAEAPAHPLGQAVKSIEAYGTRAQSDEKLSAGLCSVLALKTSVPKRYARGRIFVAPACNVAAAAEGGKWLSSNAYWTTQTSLVTALLAGYTGADNEYKLAVFSPTQVAKGEDDYSFDVTNIGRSANQYFLRSRALAGP